MKTILIFYTCLNLSALEQIPKDLVRIIACPPEDRSEKAWSECVSAFLRMFDLGPVLSLHTTRSEVLGEPSAITVAFRHFWHHTDTINKTNVEQIPPILHIYLEIMYTILLLLVITCNITNYPKPW